MKKEDFDSVINELGEPKEDTRRKQRKFKKQSEKQIMNEFYSDVEKEREKSATRQRKLYENINHLSHNEKNHF